MSAETNSSADEQDLPEIEVREAATIEDSDSYFSGIKAKVPGMNLPLFVEILSPKILQNLRSQSLETLLDGYTSGSASPTEGGINSTIVLRGFNDSSFSRNGLNDSLANVPLREVANIESVEVLKGANAVLYGAGEPGGSINIITRQPLFEAEHSAQISIGSYQKYRAELDSTGPLPGTDKFAYRMIAVYEDANSFRNTVESNKVFAAPSISWVPNDNWTVLGEMEFIQQKIPFDTGLIAIEDEFPLPKSTFLGEPALGKTRLQAVTTSFNVEYRKTDLWGLSAKLLWQGSDMDGFRAEPDELDDENPDGDLLLSRAVQHESDDGDGFSAQIEFSRKISSARVVQQILAGYEYVRVDNHVVLSESDVEEDPFEIDIFDVVYGLNSPALAALRETEEVLQQHSVYVQDFISLGDKLRVLLGARLDKIEIDINDIFLGTDIHQSDTELSSRIGVVYAMNSKLSLFTGYSESIEPNEGLTPQGSPLKPSGGKSVEGGIKFRHPFMNLSVDASLFSIEKTNVAVDAPGAPGFEIQTARQKSDGFDMLMSFSPAAWLHSKISYAYTDAEIFDDPELPDGTQPINAPLHKLVLSGFLSFRIRSENDLQAGLSFSYRSEQKASLDADELTVKLPGYWLGDLFVNYTISPRISLGLNINNLLDNTYLAASQVDLRHIHPGTPLTVMGSVRIAF